MSLSMYQASVPFFTREFEILSSILGKAAADAKARTIDESVFVTARLAPDMLPLARQVQIACDIVCRGVARLAGVELPSFEDTETTLEQLQARTAKAIAFLKTIKAEQVDGTEEKTITLTVAKQDMTFSGQDYLLGFITPNLFFHMSMTYAIFRHNGVKLGKMDFMQAA